MPPKLKKPYNIPPSTFDMRKCDNTVNIKCKNTRTTVLEFKGEPLKHKVKMCKILCILHVKFFTSVKYINLHIN